MIRTIVLIFFLSLFAAKADAQTRVNGRVLDAGTASQYGFPDSGDYWYDPVSGLAGQMGAHPTASFPTGLPLGTPSEDASGGYSFIVVNGRRLSMDEETAIYHAYTLIPDGEYTMGPDLIMRRTYPGAPAINLSGAWQAWKQSLADERAWCAYARERMASAPPATPVLLQDIGSSALTVQVTMDQNGCMQANVQGRLFERCCAG